jgi:hypothetical protein
MSNQGFEFAYGCTDEKGQRYVETEYVDCVYGHQSSQTLEEAMGGVLLAMNIFHKKHPNFVDYHAISDKCNNFATMDQIPHVMHGNATGWEQKTDPAKAVGDIFWKPQAKETAAIAKGARGKAAVGAKVGKDFGAEHGVCSGAVTSFVGEDEGGPLYVITYEDGDAEDFDAAELDEARDMAEENQIDIEGPAPLRKPQHRFPLDARKLHLHSWTNTAPQDGKDTLDCHFSFLKKARQKYVRHQGDIETPEDIVKALSTAASASTIKIPF